MQAEVEHELERINADYQSVTGIAPLHFFCPILYTDEPVELCKAHIVNQAFPNSSRTWTVQRADVDSFYGSIFESRFVGMKYAEYVQSNPSEFFYDKKAYQLLKPQILRNGEPVQPVFGDLQHLPPQEFSQMILEGKQSPILGLELAPEELKSDTSQWDISVEFDFRIDAIVSLLKAAHLTLFHMLGYRYGLSNTGFCMGPFLLGRFFDESKDESKDSVRGKAFCFFSNAKNSHLVRSTADCSIQFQGTCSDGLALFCRNEVEGFWATGVIVKTQDMVNIVLVPTLDSKESCTRMQRFLLGHETQISFSLAEYLPKNKEWIVDPQILELNWPRVELV